MKSPRGMSGPFVGPPRFTRRRRAQRPRSAASRCSGTLSAGAWPAIRHLDDLKAALFARTAAAHLVQRRGQHQVGIDAAQAQHRHLDRIVVRPHTVVVRMHDERPDHRRVVVRRHAAIGQASRRCFGEAAPLRIAEPAIGLVDGAEEGFQFLHRVEGRWAARVGANALDRRIGDLRRGVVEHQARDARLDRRLDDPARADHADGSAHRRADPMRARQLQFIEKRRCDPRVERQLVFVVRRRAPLAQAAADGVGAQHAKAASGKVAGEFVHVAPGAREAMPGDDRLAVARAPIHEVDLAARELRVVRGR